MSSHVEHAALVRCQFGSVSAPLNVTGPWPLATVRDSVPFVNVQPFGVCVCLGNPQVASATAAAGGVLAPAPCVPVTAGDWLRGNARLRVGGVPGLAPDSIVQCRWGGVLSLVTTTRSK